MDQAKQGSPPPDDVPEAQRDAVITAPPRRPWLWGVGAIALFSGAGLAAALAWWLPAETVAPMAAEETPASAPTATTDLSSNLADSVAATLTVSPTVLGHRAYDEAPAEDLVALTADGRVRLRRAAAESFQAMADEAYGSGITLVPLSGFRSEADQEYLFFDVQAERNQNPATRAEVSAPPGYSEHHTGYAIDIGDASRPDTHVEPTFAETEAYQWLEKNAARYHFELSFLPDNDQGVVFEPWHWRFVGDRHSLETFYQQRPEATP